jgi:hypothetical protein
MKVRFAKFLAHPETTRSMQDRTTKQDTQNVDLEKHASRLDCLESDFSVNVNSLTDRGKASI